MSQPDATSPQSPQILALADRFPQDEQEAIARFAGVTTDHYAFRPLLAMSQLYGLSPLLGEIWLLETDVFDRESGTWGKELRPAVGRDGFLKVLSRDDNVITPPRGNVVCSNDHFEVIDNGEEVKVDHRITLGKGSGEAAEAEARGEILGAWAILRFRDGRAPFYFYAPLSEYGKRGAVGENGQEPEEDWLGAWTYTSAMIFKCPQSYVMRVGGGITGVVPADEMRAFSGLLAGTSTGDQRPRKPAAGDNARIVEETRRRQRGHEAPVDRLPGAGQRAVALLLGHRQGLGAARRCRRGDRQEGVGRHRRRDHPS